MNCLSSRKLRLRLMFSDTEVNIMQLHPELCLPYWSRHAVVTGKVWFSRTKCGIFVSGNLCLVLNLFIWSRETQGLLMQQKDELSGPFSMYRALLLTHLSISFSWCWDKCQQLINKQTKRKIKTNYFTGEIYFLIFLLFSLPRVFFSKRQAKLNKMIP